MDPTVMLGQDLAEAARPVRDGTAADLAARDRKMVSFGCRAGALQELFQRAEVARDRCLDSWDG